MKTKKVAEAAEAAGTAEADWDVTWAWIYKGSSIRADIALWCRAVFKSERYPTMHLPGMCRPRELEKEKK